MPIYEYRCENDHTFEVMQRMADDPITVCEVCGEPVQRVFHPVAVHYKGSGFYSTDYGKKRSGASDSGGAKDESSKSESKDESKSSDSSSGSDSGSDSKKSDTKSEKKKTD